ncbi:MAG: ribonuclease activity regulator RraA, partial [Rhodospirillales bacterium]|nr:ribonuclease activity regulator RraA [Rhodospirillales bacterium]
MNPETLTRLGLAGTATLTTQMFKRGFRNIFIQGARPLGRYAANMVGPAMTLRYIPAREDLDVLEGFANPEHPQRKAIETVPAGAVLVMDCRGETRVASGGQILMTRLWKRGAAGMVSDGGLRDAAAIAELPMPVYCAGPSAPLNLVMHHAVAINEPIACGGVAVYPGDLIVGDTDGVVVVPAHLADEVAVDAAAQEHLEMFLAERVAGGAALPGTYPPDDAT